MEDELNNNSSSASRKMFSEDVDEIDEMTMLVAQWLHERGYDTTLKSLEEESGKNYTESSVRMGSQLTNIYNDYKDLQQTMAFSQMSVDGDDDTNDLNITSAPHYPSQLHTDLPTIHSQNILCVRFVPHENTTFVVSGSTDKTIKITDFTTKNVTHTFTDLALAPFISMDFNPVHPNLLLASSVDGSIVLLNINKDGTGNVIKSVKNHVKYTVRVRWSNDGMKFASCSYDKTVNYYNITNKDTWEFDLIKSFEFPFSVESLIFTPESDKLITACRETNYLQYINLQDFSIEKYNMNSNGDDHVSFSAMEFSITPNKKYLVVSTDRNRLIMFKLGTDKQVRNFYGAFNDQYCTTRNILDSNGHYLYSTSQDNMIYVWDISTQKVVSKLKNHTSSIRDLSIHPTLGYIASCSFDKKVCIWSHQD